MDSFITVSVSEVEKLIQEKKKEIEEQTETDIEKHIQSMIKPERKFLCFTLKEVTREDAIAKLDEDFASDMPAFGTNRTHALRFVTAKEKLLKDIESLVDVAIKTHTETITLSAYDSRFLNN